MLTSYQVEKITEEYQARFTDLDILDRSIRRFFEMAKDISEPTLRAWLDSDLKRDHLQHAGLVAIRREPSLSLPNGVELNDCWHCQGRGQVRRDVEPSHPDFGKALTCPSCGGGTRRCMNACCADRGVDDHSRCIDATGHDFEHPEHCPRCLAVGAKQLPIEKPVEGPVDYIAILAREMRQRGHFKQA
jgi:hypothetical protein